MADQLDGRKRQNFQENKNMADPALQWKQNTVPMTHGKLNPVLRKAAANRLKSKMTQQDPGQAPPLTTDRNKIAGYNPQKSQNLAGTSKTRDDSKPAGHRQPLEVNKGGVGANFNPDRARSGFPAKRGKTNTTSMNGKTIV